MKLFCILCCLMGLSQSEAQVFVRQSTAPLIITYQGNTVDYADNTTYSFAGRGLGDARSDRYILVAAMGRSGTTSGCEAQSATIAGVSATRINSNQTNFGGMNSHGLFLAAVPTGTSGTVSVTFVCTQTRAHISVFSLYNLQSTTPVATEYLISGHRPVTLDVSAGGVILATAWNGNQSSSTTFTGLGTAYDVNITEGGALIRAAVGYRAFGSAVTAHTISHSWSTFQGDIGIAVSLR